MIPRTLSATALEVAHLCMERFNAEFVERAPKESNNAALGGIAAHGALDTYVNKVYIERVNEPNLQFLLNLYQINYTITFKDSDYTSQEYLDGKEMLTEWFSRTDFSEFEVLSIEQKETFELKTSAGPIPFNYIFDRLDRLEDGTIRVTDYKTNRRPFSPDQLRKMVQPRIYGLAAQLKYPQAESILIEFDMLRHGGPVGIYLTKQDNRETYKWLKSEAEKIIAVAREDIRPTLNAKCNFCMIKSTCPAITSNAEVGGIFSYENATQAIDRRAALSYTQAAVKAALDELDKFILLEAEETGAYIWDNGRMTMRVTSGYGRRNIDVERAAKVLGPGFNGKYSKISDVDKLLNGDEITPQQKAALRMLITTTYGPPQIKIEANSLLDEE